MARYLQAHGLRPEIYIPDRIFEGYGPNVAAIEKLIAEGVVTRAEGDFVRMQDETAGLTLRQVSGSFKDAVAAGRVRPQVDLDTRTPSGRKLPY